MRNLFGVSLEAIVRASRVGIELKAAPEDRVDTEAEKGHYLWLDRHMAQIIAVDDHHPTPGIYNDLLPGYRVDKILRLPFGNDIPKDSPVRNREFVAINYVIELEQRHIVAP